MKRVSPINSHIFYQKSYIGGQGVVPRGAVSPYRTFFKITPPGLNTASLIAYFGILKDKKTYKGNLRWNICATGYNFQSRFFKGRNINPVFTY